MTTPEERPARRTRALSFGSVAAQYAALRPGYPAGAVAFVTGTSPRRVLDLGAGTGLLTEALVAAGHDVVAVDPSPEMLAELTARLPEVGVFAGAAEALPLPDGSVDVVVVGTAAHWFDPSAAAPEMRRVLRSGGVVGLLWNVLDHRAAWVAALSALMGSKVSGMPEAVVADFAAELDAGVATTESGFAQPMAPEDVARRVATSSSVVVLPPERRASVLGDVRDLLRSHPDTGGRSLVQLPYRTLAFRLTPR